MVYNEHSRVISGEEVLITFHGGEPLLGIEVIEQYVDRLKKYFMDRVQFCITTNGTLNEKI